MVPFALEDFFDRYEHRSGLINLASSDALPWRGAELEAKGVQLPDSASFNLAYPDVAAELLPSLCRHCAAPSDIDILPTSGAAEALALIMHVCLDEGVASSERPIAIPRPAYGAFRGLADLLKLPVVFYSYDPKRNWTLDVDALLDLCKRCSVIVVINPHNPTGHVIPLDALRTMADTTAAHGSLLIIDEVFRVHDETPSAVTLGSRAVVLGSLSKTYGLPGLRLGWIAADESRCQRLRTVQQYLTLTLNAVTVALGAAALQQIDRVSRAELIRANRLVVSEWAKNCDSVTVSEPLGGTTVCLAIETARRKSSLFDEFLEAGVLLVPGNRCFGEFPGVCWFRLGYGTATDALRRGLDAIGRTLATA